MTSPFPRTICNLQFDHGCCHYALDDLGLCRMYSNFWTWFGKWHSDSKIQFAYALLHKFNCHRSGRSTQGPRRAGQHDLSTISLVKLVGNSMVDQGKKGLQGLRWSRDRCSWLSFFSWCAMAKRSRCNPSKQLTMKAAVESVSICLNCFAVAAYRCGLCDEQCLLCCQHGFGQALEQCQHGFDIIGGVSQMIFNG